MDLLRFMSLTFLCELSNITIPLFMEKEALVFYKTPLICNILLGSSVQKMLQIIIFL